MAEQVIRVAFHVFSQKLTTYARSAAALEAYWAQRAAAGSAPVGPSFPGGEKALAYKTREACWKDSVHLDHHAGGQSQEWQGVPADIEEKETVRTRGITGFTGKQPQPGCSKPPSPAPDTSRWVAINAFDEPKPRVKGIVGYTGHQPPSPAKSAAGQLAAAGPLGEHSSQGQATWCSPRHAAC
ncbi:hypothetical protein OEZ86_009956 [Tetradesmus obliquus]|uniref:Uncharacterized protein n=1 Tax=Tetradesmus obliquus TaxID=3088 RepID=A0ABY8UP27_TETOB|nr:hypothetical protein OEZ85_001390 [Tetradesmus obliquus]WIA43493.1 hypothetical protein OEZ86_009956 [Tetradesmus obliquus]